MSTPSDPRFKARFSAQAYVYQPTPEDKQEARASLDGLKGLLPPEINPEADVDLVYVVGNLAVPGLMNQNDDAVTIEQGLAMYKQFERRQCNVEHNREHIVGYIVKAGLSEFGTNRLLTEDEVRVANKPYNIVTVAALWKVANRDLCDFVLQSSAPGSPDRNALSLSFEVGFNGYEIALLPEGVTDLACASLVSEDSDGERFDKLSKVLRVNKGSGKTKEGQRVGRVLAGALIPLGQGVVTVPAAQVKGLEPILSNPAAEATSLDDVVPADQGQNQVYNSVTIPMSEQITKANRVKIPVGLASKVKDLNYPKFDVHLSDGRVLKGVTVLSGEELDLDKETAQMEGVVITNMTPFEQPQIDDSPVIHPNIGLEYPNKMPAARAEDAKQEEQKKEGQNAPYTDASVEAAAKVRTTIVTELLKSMQAARSIIASASGVSLFQNNPVSTPQSLSSMKLEDLKQIEARVKAATKPEEVTEAFANMTLFVEEIVKASEKHAKDAKDAADKEKQAKDETEAMKLQLAEATKALTEIRQAQATAEAEAKFQARMTTVASEIELDDEARAYVVEDIKACADDAAFEKYLAKAKKLMKGKKKDDSKTKKDDSKDGKKGNGKDDDDGDDDAAKAARVAIASATANPTDALDIDPVTTAAAPSMNEQYKKAFLDGVSIGGRKLSDIIK